MGDISENFSRAEFACKCGCGMDTVDAELVAMLEELRIWVNAPIAINSGCRCGSYNHAIGGYRSSQHLACKAADCVVDGWEPHEVQALFGRLWPDKYGMGSYDSFTHVDSRAGKARWTG